MTSKAARFITQLMAEIAERDARIAELERFKCAYNEWHEKTEWVQSEVSTGIIGASALGLHRADVMTRLVAELRLEIAALKAQQPSGVGGEREAPYSSGVAESLERTDWTPEQALRWYAEGRHFDTVHGRTRIIDTGAIASNALKHASLKYIELKGDAELTELREKVAISLVCGGVVMPERMQYVRYFRGVVPENRLEAEAHTDGWNSCLDEVARLNPCRAQAVPDGWRMVKVGAEGVQFGNAWFSHEGITGYTAEQLNSGNCRVTGRAYMDWFAAAPPAKKESE